MHEIKSTNTCIPLRKFNAQTYTAPLQPIEPNVTDALGCELAFTFKTFMSLLHNFLPTTKLIFNGKNL